MNLRGFQPESKDFTLPKPGRSHWFHGLSGSRVGFLERRSGTTCLINIQLGSIYNIDIDVKHLKHAP